MSRRALFFVNDRARRGRESVSQIRDHLTAGGLELLEVNKDQGALPELIHSHRNEADLVIVGGGDGTIHQTLSSLLKADLPVGILPLGTANDLARTLHLPFDPIEACNVILQGHSQRIDVGLVNDRPFLNVASIGLSGELTRRMSRGAKTRFGVLAYVWAALGALLRARPFTAEIVSEKETVRSRTWQIAIGNGRSYGGGLTVHASARIDDGLLDLYSVEITRSWQFLLLIPALWRGTLDPIHTVRTRHGTQFSIRPISRPRTITADGEIIGQTPAEFRLMPKALSVFVPFTSASDETNP